MYSTLALALLSTVSAQTFGLMTIRSGSQVQNSEVKLSSDGHLSLNGESEFTGNFADGMIKTSDGKYLNVYQGYLWLREGGNGAWSIADDHLTIDGHDSWVVCPNDNNNIKFQVAGSESPCDGAIGVALHVIQTGGNQEQSSAAPAPDASTAAPTDAPAEQSTEVVEQTVVETVCTHETCTGVAPANGAASNGAILGGVAAAFAALL